MKAVDKKRLIIECGDAAYLLFDYWLSVSGQYDGVLTDTKAAQNLGWKTTKVKRVREKLQRFGWYKATKYPAANDGTRMIRYDLGKVEKPGDLQESFNRSVFKKVKPNLKQHSQTEENAA